MLVGQALIAANLCGECGEGLRCSTRTGERCAPNAPDAHFHEKQGLYGGLVPLCCPCLRGLGIECADMARALAEAAVAEAIAATEGDDGS